jgi:hypothetical protein
MDILSRVTNRIQMFILLTSIYIFFILRVEYLYYIFSTIFATKIDLALITFVDIFLQEQMEGKSLKKNLSCFIPSDKKNLRI